MIKIKKIIYSIITLFALITTNLILSKIFKISFMELAFFTGLFFTVAIYYFSSEGGFTTEMLDAPFKRFLEKESRTQAHFIKFNISTPFIVSLLYTLISAILSIIIYWEHF